MGREGARAIESRTEKLVGWRVWVDRFVILMAIGGTVFGLGIAAALFLSVAAVGAGYPEQDVDFGPLNILAGAAMGFGLLLFFIGGILWAIATATYNAHKRATLASREMEDAVVDSLVAHVQGKNGGRYKAIITILGDLGNKRATAAIIPALKDEDAEARQKAAEALGKIEDEAALEPLVLALRDTAKAVRKEVAGAVEKRGWEPSDDAQKADYLFATERWDELARLGKPAVDPLIEGLKDDDKKVRQKAAAALGNIGDERAAEPLADALKDKEEDVRKAAQAALKRTEKKQQER